MQYISKALQLKPISSYIFAPSTVSLFRSEILAANSYNLTPKRFYKVYDHLTLRCRDCYFDRREGRLYVECKTHPRHKQMQKMRDPIRPWEYKRKVWKTVCWW
ncbi:unnamed protein product [Calicophoron daubneyi]|uniref:Ribosomal protein n=1 Tax=Calicophoron daubneyi TaxID=300641 RepID=A0AAV2T2J1_CALDB